MTDHQTYESLALINREVEEDGALSCCEAADRQSSRVMVPLGTANIAPGQWKFVTRIGCALALVACVAVAVFAIRSGSDSKDVTNTEDAVVMYAADFCNAFQGIMNHDKACCPKSCGVKCGAVDCWAGVGGPSACCWTKMDPDVFCTDASTQQAPCLLPPTTTTSTTTSTTSTTTIRYNVYRGTLKLESSMPLTLLGNRAKSKKAIQIGLQNAFLGSKVRVTSLTNVPYQGVDVDYILQMKDPAETEAARFPGEDATALIEIKEALEAIELQPGAVSKVTLDEPTVTNSALPAIV